MQNTELCPRYQVDLIVDGRSHLYDVTQEHETARYPSVTGFLGIIAKPALVPWAKREALSVVQDELMKRLGGQNSATITLDKSWIENILRDSRRRPDQLKDAAADLGTKAHALIDRIVRGEQVAEIPAEIEAPVKAFQQWWAKSGIELVLGDTRVASRQYGYGGSLDALGRRNGKLVLIDWKTSTAIYTEYALQAAAYAQAFKETYGVACSEAFIVRFGKKLPIEFEVKELADLDLSFQAFLAAKTLKESLEKPHFLPW